MIGIPLGMLYSNVGEWLIHKYVLHGLGRKKGTYWSFHWHEHHRNARREAMTDGDYKRSLWGWHGQAKEALGLVTMAAAHLPLARRAPWFVATVVFCHARYYYAHKRSHRDPEWAKQHLPWHYDHHMGPNQHANWCVTAPWFDMVMGTREPYVGTAREAMDNDRKRARVAPNMQPAI
jgi:hypothetical protein